MGFAKSLIFFAANLLFLCHRALRCPIAFLLTNRLNDRRAPIPDRGYPLEQNPQANKHPVNRHPIRKSPTSNLLKLAYLLFLATLRSRKHLSLAPILLRPRLNPLHWLVPLSPPHPYDRPGVVNQIPDPPCESGKIR